MIAALNDTATYALIGSLGLLLLVAMILAYRLMRDTPLPRTKRTRVGVFIERDREPSEQFDPETTAEYPPIKERP